MKGTRVQHACVYRKHVLVRCRAQTRRSGLHIAHANAIVGVIGASHVLNTRRCLPFDRPTIMPHATNLVSCNKQRMAHHAAGAHRFTWHGQRLGG
jgi:hypothetical protein